MARSAPCGTLVHGAGPRTFAFEQTRTVSDKPTRTKEEVSCYHERKSQKNQGGLPVHVLNLRVSFNKKKTKTKHRNSSLNPQLRRPSIRRFDVRPSPSPMANSSSPSRGWTDSGSAAAQILLFSPVEQFPTQNGQNPKRVSFSTCALIPLFQIGGGAGGLQRTKPCWCYLNNLIFCGHLFGH